MLFNSLEFLIFLPTVFFFYWFVFNKSLKYQNLFILFASYVFYGWWDWRFLTLIFISTAVDFLVGKKIFYIKENSIRKFYLFLSILFNLSLLGFFKYYNFFVQSWIDLVSVFGYGVQSLWTLKIILPVGISFYTFQSMSYTLDVYNRKIIPTNDFISFASYVSFFPQLVAGPIERSTNLLPQMLAIRSFRYRQAVEGLRLILWGIFKKVVIADSLAWRVNYCFDNYNTLDGGTLLLGLIYFGIQLYCDFSGYSDTAIGTAKLFGIELMSNFNYPFFARNIAEFWRRWHISLSTWFRDYLFIPLGGSKGGKWLSIRNIFIVFIVSGFWHGPNWTFIAWGLMHAFLYLGFLLISKNSKDDPNIVAKNKILSTIRETSQVVITYLSVTFTWVFFRSETIEKSFDYLIQMVTNLSIPIDNKGGLFYVATILIFDWVLRRDERSVLLTNNLIQNWIIILAFSLIIFFFSLYHPKSEFIYYQF
ncbi:MAG: membrane-bound O-acyltransferase family protein [Candidatus Marinimicrobia bacterium]|nr:membrane-bound O-acyltransferase family protein [Candidatus Neomarinimicrobiota bacterium]